MNNRDDVVAAIQISALALIGMLAELGETKVATVIGAAMQAYCIEDKEQGAAWLERLSVVAEEIKAEYQLGKIEWPDVVN